MIDVPNFPERELPWRATVSASTYLFLFLYFSFSRPRPLLSPPPSSLSLSLSSLSFFLFYFFWFHFILFFFITRVSAMRAGCHRRQFARKLQLKNIARSDPSIVDPDGDRVPVEMVLEIAAFNSCVSKIEEGWMGVGEREGVYGD